jgi:hypothetical protein
LYDNLPWIKIGLPGEGGGGDAQQLEFTENIEGKKGCRTERRTSWGNAELGLTSILSIP